MPNGPKKPQTKDQKIKVNPPRPSGSKTPKKDQISTTVATPKTGAQIFDVSADLKNPAFAKENVIPDPISAKKFLEATSTLSKGLMDKDMDFVDEDGTPQPNNVYDEYMHLKEKEEISAAYTMNKGHHERIDPDKIDDEPVDKIREVQNLVHDDSDTKSEDTTDNNFDYSDYHAYDEAIKALDFHSYFRDGAVIVATGEYDLPYEARAFISFLLSKVMNWTHGKDFFIRESHVAFSAKNIPDPVVTKRSFMENIPLPPFFKPPVYLGATDSKINSLMSSPEEDENRSELNTRASQYKQAEPKKSLKSAKVKKAKLKTSLVSFARINTISSGRANIDLPLAKYHDIPEYQVNELEFIKQVLRLEKCYHRMSRIIAIDTFKILDMGDYKQNPLWNQRGG